MEIDEIKTLLHQGEDYLMLTKVLKHDANSIESVKIHTGDENHVKNHFPGAPIVPGSMLQEMCTQSAGLLITKYYSPVPNYDSKKTKGHALGVLNRVTSAKFYSMVKPDTEIIAKVKLIDHFNELFKFQAEVFQSGEIKAKLSFNLVNISDDYLTN